MNYNLCLFLAVLANLLALTVAECPNACSAHGKCGAYDMCTCYRNWMANDCSERICQFGLAHVDTPKGDLDSSGGALTGPGVTVVVNDQMYPYGTTEKYPAMEDMNQNILDETAHEYRECSNKGICDRSTGTCACFEGYEGSACQRASCPVNANGVCSGHGTCQTISEIAALDGNNFYKLWDQDATMGCVCDGGYEGADCSMRSCKVGVDPYYKDNNATIRYANFTFQFYTESSSVNVYGNYSITFYDSYGEDWQTEPIPFDAPCADLATILESLPNNVIPKDSVRCFKFDTSSTYGQTKGLDPIYNENFYVVSKYTIAFPQNPGKLPQITINKFLDGSRPTLYTDEMYKSTLGWHIYPNGFIGEDVDMVPDRCYDVTVTLGAGGSGSDTDPFTHYLAGLSTQEAKLLKTCLGDSDGDASNNIEVYNWDYGDAFNPHLIKLKEATQYVPSLRTTSDGETIYDPTLYTVPISTLCADSEINAARFGTGYCSNADPPGFFAVLFYDITSLYPFRLYTRAAHDYDSTTEFYVYTTTGYLNLVNPFAVVFTEKENYPTKLTIQSSYSNVLGMAPTSFASTNAVDELSDFDGDMSCELTPIGNYRARDCFNKNDYAMFINTKNTSNGINYNPVYPNIYQIQKIFVEEKMNSNFTLYPQTDKDLMIGRLRIHLDYSMNARFRFTNASHTDSAAQAYKFHPPTAPAEGGYLYASQCSGRGICNYNTGLCECFNGFADDDCSCINAAAV